MDRRLRREARTVEAMIDLYCKRSKHDGPRPCAECRELLAYSLARLEKCPFGGGKPTCANCTVHCYRPDMRARARSVMREAGPRMVYRHPFLALLHLVVDARRAAPDPRAVRARNGPHRPSHDR
jgi:hypothetical protein